MKKLLLGLGAVATTIAPFTALSMKANASEDKDSVKVFDNVFNKTYDANQNGKEKSDVAKLIYENRSDKVSLKNYIDFHEVDIDVTPPSITDYKITIIGIENEIYGPDGEGGNYRYLKIVLDVKDIKSGKHWGYYITTTDPKSYKNENSAYSGFVKYVYTRFTMEGEWFKGLDENSIYRERYILREREYYETLKARFFDGDLSIFSQISKFITTMKGGTIKLTDEMKTVGINRDLNLHQLFNRNNSLYFVNSSGGKKVVINSNKFEYGTRTKGFISPSDLLNNKELYKKYLLAALKAKNINIDPSKIDVNKDISVKVKKVIFVPEFALNGEWDLHYRTELSGSILGKSVLLHEKEVGLLSKAQGSYTQNINTYLQAAAKAAGFDVDIYSLYPIKNNFRTYDEYKNSDTQRAMKELFKRASFAIDVDYDLTNNIKDLPVDINILNTFIYDNNKKFTVQLTDMTIGFEYEIQINDDIVIPGIGTVLDKQ